MISWLPIHSQMNIPKTYKGRNFEALDNRKGLKHLQPELIEMAKAQKWAIFCSDLTGIGKTWLAVCFMSQSWLVDVWKPSYLEDTPGNYQNRNMDSYHFLSAWRLGNELKVAGYKLNEIFDRVLIGHRCLLLDDLGREGTGEARLRMEQLIDECYTRGKQLIATTNFTAAEFRNPRNYDPAIIRRIKEKGKIYDLKGS